MFNQVANKKLKKENWNDNRWLTMVTNLSQGHSLNTHTIVMMGAVRTAGHQGDLEGLPPSFPMRAPLIWLQGLYTSCVQTDLIIQLTPHSSNTQLLLYHSQVMPNHEDTCPPCCHSPAGPPSPEWSFPTKSWGGFSLGADGERKPSHDHLLYRGRNLSFSKWK
jgi:hypothetical protein